MGSVVSSVVLFFRVSTCGNSGFSPRERRNPGIFGVAEEFRGRKAFSDSEIGGQVRCFSPPATSGEMSETIDVSDEQDDGRDHSFEEANLDKPAAIRRPVRRQPDRSGGDHREGRRHLRADRELLLLHHYVIKQIGKRPSAISSCRTKAGQQQRRCFLMAGKRCALKEDHRTTSGCSHVCKRECGVVTAGLTHVAASREYARLFFHFLPVRIRAFALRSFSSGDLASQSTKDG